MMLKNKRYDVRAVRFSGYRVEVYWRADELGDGPCMSLHVGRREHARFDLFTPAHKHLYRQPYQPRIYYPEGKTRAEYIELAIADLLEIYPPAIRVAGWAAEQLAAITKPAITATAPGKSRPLRLDRSRQRPAPPSRRPGS